MSVLHCTFICAYLVIVGVSGIRFYAQPTVFYVSDTNVKLICANVSHSSSQIFNVSRLSIEKQGSNGIWEDMAIIESHSASVEIHGSGMTATGSIGIVSKAHLTVTWPVVSTDQLGKYRCEAVGFTAIHEVMVEKSAVLDLREIPSGSGQIFEYIARSDRNLVRNMEESLLKTLQKKIDTSTQIIESGSQYSFAKFSSELNSRLDNIKSLTDKLVLDFLGRLHSELTWPEGSFTLLMPDTGCPSLSAQWKTGYLQQNAKDQNNKYAYPGLHMALPSYRGGHLFQHFCSLETSPDRQREWPEGAYCITQSGHFCPNGFNTSMLKYDVEDGGRISQAVGTLPAGTYTTPWTQIVKYCCRHDGDPQNPIDLPWSKPFYLYRHQGKCQRVKRMDVVNDGFLLTTATDDHGDVWQLANSYQPDFQIRPIRAELCYYVKSDFLY